MLRTNVSLFIILAMLSSCTSSPEPQQTITPMFINYSGSADDSATVDHAALPSAGKNIRGAEARVFAAQYEADMDEFLASGDYIAAVDACNKATKALSSGRAPESAYGEIREKMDVALGAVRFTASSIPVDTVVGRAFSRSFAIKAVAVQNSKEVPLVGLPCTVHFPIYAEDGTVTRSTVEILTNATGIASFTAPVPPRSGVHSLEIVANLLFTDEALSKSVTRRIQDGSLSVSFVHGVETAAKSIPTTISILDFDKNDKPVLYNNFSATQLLRPLVQKGFSRIGMADFPKQLAAGDEEKLLAAARAQFGSAVQRFIYGTTRVVSLVQGEDGTWSCTLEADVSVWNFVLNEKQFQKTLRHTVLGKSEAAALDTARKELAGSVLVDDLRYNL